MNKDGINQLCNQVRESAFSLHKHLRHGHLEGIYENGLTKRLTKLGAIVPPQAPVAGYDEDGTILGDLNANLLVELKVVCAIYVAQLLGYLRGSAKWSSLLIDFASQELFIKRYILDPS
jgi:GxxExxY protein